MQVIIRWKPEWLNSDSSFVVLDQMAVSLGNFITNLVLIRSLTPGAFGIYATLWSMMLLLNTVQSSLIVHPMLVIAAAGQEGHARRLATAGLWATALIALPFAPIVAIAAAVLHNGGLAICIIPALLAWQLQEAMRRALMSQQRYRDCILGDSVSYLGQASILMGLAALGRLSFSALFVCMMGTSLLAGLIQAWQVRPAPIRMGEFVTIIREFWKIGRWIANLNVVASVTTVAMPWYLTLLRGPVAAAGYQALLYVTGVVQPLVLGIGSLVTVGVARSAALGTLRTSLRAISRPVVLGAGVISVYGIVLSLFPATALAILFRSRSPYLDLAPQLPLFAAAALLLYLSQMLGEVLVGLRATRKAFLCQLYASLACALTAIAAVPVRPVWGGGIALIAANSARLVAAAFLLHRTLDASGQWQPAGKSMTAGGLTL